MVQKARTEAATVLAVFPSGLASDTLAPHHASLCQGRECCLYGQYVQWKNCS